MRRILHQITRGLNSVGSGMQKIVPEQVAVALAWPAFASIGLLLNHASNKGSYIGAGRFILISEEEFEARKLGKLEGILSTFPLIIFLFGVIYTMFFLGPMSPIAFVFLLASMASGKLFAIVEIEVVGK